MKRTHAPSVLLPFLVLALALPAFAAGDAATEAATEAAPAEAPDPHRAAMEALPDMVGTWEGEGWMRRGPGEPSYIDSREIVESRLDGRAWVIEGIHHSRDTGDRVHHALALLTWDEEAGRYAFRSYVAGRGGGNFHGRVEDGAFVWEMEPPEGRIRYIIRVEDDTWTESGHFSRDGETWNEFFGMTLTRTD